MVGYLSHPPTFEICGDSIKRSVFQDYINFFMHISAKYEPTDIYVGDCKSEWRQSLIRVDRADPFDLEFMSQPGHMVQAYFEYRYQWHSGTLEIKYGTIYLGEKDNFRIAIHEIAHSYGWDHVDIAGHVMHPNNPGRGTLGLENLQYLYEL